MPASRYGPFQDGDDLKSGSGDSMGSGGAATRSFAKSSSSNG